MRLPGIFSGRPSQPETELFHWQATPTGLEFRTGAVQGAASARLISAEAQPLLDQLATEEMASITGDGFLISWDQVHELLRSRAYASSVPLLQLPNPIGLVPQLRSIGSLTDTGFSIGVSGWLDDSGNIAHIDSLIGCLVGCSGELRLLSAAVWRLLCAVNAFAQRSPDQRSPQQTRRGWGVIRRLAVEADAALDEFLIRSIILTPDKLDIQFRKVDVGGTSIVEIVPGFDGAPERWIESFDKAPSVPEHFNIPTQAGAVHVALSVPVRAVLREIKRLPGRRAAGARAEAFLLNPFSALGDQAAEVIDAEQFAAAKQTAGVSFERFRPFVERDSTGYSGVVGIEIDTPDGELLRRVFSSDEDLQKFVAGLSHRLRQGLQLYAWQEFEFELDGDATAHLAVLQSALDERTKPPVVIHHDKVFDLSSYYDRVVGVGKAEPFISAYIVKKSDEEGWFQSNLLALLKFRPSGADDDVTVPLTSEALPDIEQAMQDAKLAGADMLQLAGCTHPLPIDEIEAAIEVFKAAIHTPPASRKEKPVEDERRPPRPTLLIKGNIDSVGHLESREEKLATNERSMVRPSSLKSTVELRDHQLSGIARLQQLFEASPDHCRGVLMADDMGLGKTLQLLTFMAWAIEQNAQLTPALVVAPVSLLENWREEIARFFEPDAMQVLTAYGDEIAKLRVPRANIDADLQKEGLVRFLAPGWRGSAQVVLTTYETLRDLEFSFAQEPWSILVCDEAQKIKNPNAMVTRAAKKLNVRFRVACTGTPVENSLADLWCLFDFVQPGLLGALNEFGRNFGRSIETDAGTATDTLEHLRQLIDPQVIRRTKADVAKDLPRKIEAQDCTVGMSNEQRAIYVGALELFNQADPEEDEARLHHLGLLQHLRLVCADPRQYGIETFIPEEPRLYRRKAPKMDWLLRTLHAVRLKNEKALVFAEHRDVQRLLQHYIKLEFGFQPRIVNGDTSVSSRAESNRQKLLNEFQRVPGFGVLILSPLAVGFGVNIQAANHVIHYLRHWNPAKEDQATDRAYRIGQTRDVHVYCPLTVASDFKTFDVKLDELLRRKRALAVDMLQGAGAVSGSEFDLEEIIPEARTTLRTQPVTLELIERSSPSFFEAIAAALWHKQGFRSHLTQQSDAGVDVVGVHGSQGVLIQCKSSSNPDRQLGWEAVRDVVGGTAIYAEQFPAVRFRRLAITNQTFNERAHERARANGVELIEQNRLAQLIIEHPITTMDVLAIRSAPRL